MIIHPEIIVTPDCPTIRFRSPIEQVNLETDLPRILHTQGWGCGTYFHVQFISHDKTKLLAAALFVVSEESESLITNEANPYQPISKTVFNRKADQVGQWWQPQEGREEVEASLLLTLAEVQERRAALMNSAEPDETEAQARARLKADGTPDRRFKLEEENAV